MKDLQAELEQFLNQKQLEFQKESISPLVDLTLLDQQADPESITHIWKKGLNYKVAALCLYPEHYALLPEKLTLKKATVINFPEGKNDLDTLLKRIDLIIEKYVIDEIDYVFPYSQYLTGQQTQALWQSLQIIDYCLEKKVIGKVIVESGAFTSLDTLYQLAQQLLEQNWHFLKTSTGKIATGATPAAVFCLLKAISKVNCKTGIKVSGGVKTPEQAQFYMGMAQTMLNKALHPSWFRLGASSLLDTL